MASKLKPLNGWRWLVWTRDVWKKGDKRVTIRRDGFEEIPSDIHGMHPASSHTGIRFKPPGDWRKRATM